MTSEEKRHQKAMLLLEHQEASEHLANLEEKAVRLAQLLELVSLWVKQGSKSYMQIEDEIGTIKLGPRINIATDPQITDAMDFPNALSLIKDIKAARERVKDLEARKSRLGLK